MKKRVLVFCEFYRPGYKGGGGMWSVVNLVGRLSDHFDFSVVCRNHDGGSAKAPYNNVATDQWNDLDGHRVFYTQPSKCTKQFAAEVIRETDPDVIFANSVFGLTTRAVLEARRKRLFGNIPVVVAPCGELSGRCLAIKSLKKGAFLKYARLFSLYDGVVWKASTELEAKEIREQFGSGVKIEVAPDIAPNLIFSDNHVGEKPEKFVGTVKLISVARFAPIKNIAYLLERLAECREGNYELNLIGGVDDEGYWRECESLINQLPTHVKVNILGPVENSEVIRQMQQSHFFVLPTLSENFGYAFLEALTAGCPILISENTIWSPVDDAGCGHVLRLDSPRSWVTALESCAAMPGGRYAEMSTKAREFAREWLSDSEDVSRNAQLLESAIRSRRIGKINVG